MLDILNVALVVMGLGAGILIGAWVNERSWKKLIDQAEEERLRWRLGGER